MAKKAKSTLGKVKEAVVEAATVVAKAADAHVVQPVGKAVGLVAPAPAKPKPGRAKRAAAKRPAKDPKKPTLKTVAAEKKPTDAPKSAAAKKMTKGIAPAVKKPGGR